MSDGVTDRKDNVTVAEPNRDFPFHAKRVLVIGLDGATFGVLEPLLAAGRLPNLQRVISSGVAGTLQSTTPPITPAAWTTFLTGKQPGSHGIIDFERYDTTTNRLLMNSTRCLDGVRNIWQILSDRGFRVGSVNVPMTYPPIPVNGFMVSGFETPGPQSEFVYPRDLREEILARWPDPTLRKNWRRKWLGGLELYRKNVDYMARSFHQGAEMTMALGDKMGWDALMVVFKLVDNLQHKTWKYIDPRWSDRDPVRRDIAFACFEEADRAVGILLEYATAQDAMVMIVSDHGHGSLDGKVQPNLLLNQWGYLALEGGGSQGVTRGRGMMRRFLGGRKSKRVDSIAEDLAVDFSRTRACVMHAGMAGFLYINLAGRQPDGIVPPNDYEALRDELRDRLLGPQCRVTDPLGEQVQLFSAVHKPEELYGCSREAQPWLPDLILTPRDGLAVIRKIRGRRSVRWLPYRRIEGTHRPHGILIAGGPGVASGRKVSCHIVDCAPTLLALLGLRIPDDMEGRVVDEIFERPPTVETAAPTVSAPDVTQEEVYSSAELDQITERLSDLGYLE